MWRIYLYFGDEPIPTPRWALYHGDRPVLITRRLGSVKRSARRLYGVRVWRKVSDYGWEAA